MNKLRQAVIGAVLAALALAPSVVGATQVRALSDAQMDAISAGNVSSAAGDGDAKGDVANSQVSVAALVSGGPIEGAASGSVTASASSAAGGAQASSTLFLSVSVR